MRRNDLLIIAALAGSILTVTRVLAQDIQNANSPTRGAPRDPVILTGEALPKLLGLVPRELVAFAVRNGEWVQIPVQVDERVRTDFGKVMQRSSYEDQEALFYADPNTHTGSDTDPKFDADDELVLMASDFGARAVKPANPAHTKAPRVELEIEGTAAGFAYLFASDGSLDPAAGVDRVRYTFKLTRGEYKDNYRLRRGKNPEDSSITATAYRLGFRERWVHDELRITVGGAQGADILDRHKVQVIPGNCIRTTKTFSEGQGAIVANIDGPLRVIRSIVGANSGPLTQRRWICYPERFDVVTVLRVHGLPSMFMFFDYNENAKGMRYHDNNNLGGFVIDGKPDPFKPGVIEWQFVSGEPGSLEIYYALNTSIKDLNITSLYDDSLEPVWKQCTGDPHTFGAAGPKLGRLKNTDPRGRTAEKLESLVTVYPGAPRRTLNAEKMKAHVPFKVKVR